MNSKYGKVLLVQALFADMILEVVTAVILHGSFVARFYQIEVLLPAALVNIAALGELVGLTVVRLAHPTG